MKNQIRAESRKHSIWKNKVMVKNGGCMASAKKRKKREEQARVGSSRTSAAAGFCTGMGICISRYPQQNHENGWPMEIASLLLSRGLKTFFHSLQVGGITLAIINLSGALDGLAVVLHFTTHRVRSHQTLLGEQSHPPRMLRWGQCSNSS